MLMRAVTNRRKQEYPLDQGSRQARGDGEIYQVQGRSDLWVKILNDHSREKQLEIEKRLTGGGSGEESPMEIVYYRGRFTGYTFRKLPEVEPKREAEPPQAPEPSLYREPSPDPRDRDPRRNNGRQAGRGASRGTGGERFLICLGVWVVLSILQYFVFYPMYRGYLLSHAAAEVVAMSLKLSAMGITALVAGTILMFLAAKAVFYRVGGVALALGEAAAYLIGIVTVNVLLMILSVGVLTLLAVLPYLAAIVVIILVVHAIFKK